MNESQKLFRQAADLFEQAKAALVAGNDNAGELKTQAESMLERAEAVKAIEVQQKALIAPVHDVALPVDTGNPVAVPPVPAPENELNKSIYQIRFGDMDAATKAVIQDLHGADYQNKVLEQKAAFVRYIRKGDKELTASEIKALKTIYVAPQQAREQMAKGIDVRDIKASLVEAIDTLGGYAVPVDINMDIIKRIMGMTVMRGRAKMRQTSRDRIEILKRSGGDDQYTGNVRITWVDEIPTVNTTSTNPTFAMEGIPVHTAMAETFMSRNVVEDAAYDLIADLTEQLSEAAAIDEDNCFLTGDGVGKPQGLLPGGANSLNISEVNSGHATTLQWSPSATKGLVALSFGIASQYRTNAVWIGERNTYAAIAAMTDGVQQPLWRDMHGRSTSEGGAGTQKILLGYNVLEQEAMPSIGANTYPLVFGDPRGYTIVDRIGMTIERYLDSGTARTNQICYVMRRRLGGQPTELYRFAVQKVAA